MEKTINTDEIEKAINHLMKVVDEELEKNEPKAFDKFVETLVEKMGDEVYKSQAGDLMDSIHELSEPDYKKKRLLLGSALNHAKDDAVFLLENFTDSAFRLHKYIESNSQDDDLIQAMANQLKSFADKVQDAVVSELYERVQGYRYDIEKLTSGTVHA